MLPTGTTIWVLTEANRSVTTLLLPEEHGLQRGYAIGASGYLGVLSDEAYRLGGFAAATVLPTSSGFVVRRWSFRGHPANETPRVERVEEAVGRDGSYSRRVVESRPAPQLPQTEWRWPRLL